MNITCNENEALLDDLRQCFDYLSHHKVSVGIPPEKNARDGPFTNTELLHLMETGSPVNHMPPRPVMAPALNDPATRQAMTQAMTEAAAAASLGNLVATQAALEKSGEAAVAAIRRYILSGTLAPNAAITIHGGWMRNPVSHKPVYIKGKGANRPLIDSGKLIGAFGYTIDES